MGFAQENRDYNVFHFRALSAKIFMENPSNHFVSFLDYYRCTKFQKKIMIRFGKKLTYVPRYVRTSKHGFTGFPMLEDQKLLNWLINAISSATKSA